MKKTVNLENEKLLYSYHTQLVSLYDEKSGKSTLRGAKRSENPGLFEYFEFASGFGDLLVDIENEDRAKTDALYAIGSGKSAEQSVDFGHLLIVLSRAIPLVDMIVKRICDMNIGVGVTGDTYSVQSMKEALIWLNVKANDSRELAYYDIEKLQRFLHYQVIRYKRFFELEASPERIIEASGDAIGEFWELEPKDRINLIYDFKNDKTVPLINDTFYVFELLHAYYDYMRLSDKTVFESQKKNAGEWTEEYKKIFDLAVNVQNIIFRRFASMTKINDMNIPHGAYSYSDLVSTTMSDSNLINSDFHFSDFTDAVLKNCDVSASDFTYVTANNSDFSRSNMNACNLSGSVFDNATLTDVQMLNVLFRDSRLDELEHNNWELTKAKKSGNKKLDITIAFAQKRDTAFGNYQIGEKAAKFIAEKLPRMLGAYTVREDDRTIVAREAMNGLLREYAEATSDYFASLEYKVITPEAMRELSTFYNAERLSDRRKREKNLKINVISSSFRDATMNRALLPHADLSHVSMRSATLNDGDLNDATCFHTDFIGASMTGANLSNAEFYKAKLEGANLSKANLINVGFIDCLPKGASFANALLIKAAFVNTSASEAYIGKLLKENPTSPVEALANSSISIYGDESLNDCSFNGSVATDIILVGINADQSTWVSAEMRRAVIFNTIARWTQFDKADLSYSLIFGASFHQSSFTEAMFANAKIYACDLSGIRLHRSNFISTRVEKTVIQNADMSNCNLSRAEFKNCAFSDVNFSDVNISDALFENVIFDNVSFESCIGMSTARFKHCYFSDSCYKLQFQTDADGKPNKSFMSIPHGPGRVKFFKDDEQDYKSFGERQYTSINHHIEASRQN